MGLFFYRPPPVLEAVDGFEYADGWPGTIADINYPLSFSFSSPETSATENFESGW
jgi:hypothetical protein